MKHILKYFGFYSILALLIVSCGPSEKEKQQQRQARQDSLEQVRRDSMQQAEQQRQDSLASARADSMSQENRNSTGNATASSLSEDGRYSLQVESWRSRQHAQKKAEKWKERGFDHAYVVEYGHKETGNVWYRLRLGRIDSRQHAQELKQMLKEKYQTKAWIARAN